MVICRLEAADHREKAPPWDTVVVNRRGVDYSRQKEEERKRDEAFEEAMARLYEKVWVAKRRRQSERQSRKHENDMRLKVTLSKATAIKEEKQHNKPRSIWVSVKTDTTTNQTDMTAGRFVPIPPEATKEQTAIMISDARAELMHELEKRVDTTTSTDNKHEDEAKSRHPMQQRRQQTLRLSGGLFATADSPIQNI